MTESVPLDGNYLPGLIDKIDGPIDQITGDGAYDKKNRYQAAYKRGAKAVHEMFRNVGRKTRGESRGVYFFIHEHDES